jgi:hypothetical protein
MRVDDPRVSRCQRANRNELADLLLDLGEWIATLPPPLAWLHAWTAPGRRVRIARRTAATLAELLAD